MCIKDRSNARQYKTRQIDTAVLKIKLRTLLLPKKKIQGHYYGVKLEMKT